MHLGDMEVHLLGDGTFRLDGGAMFGVIPRPLWEKKSPPDDRNRILLAMNILLIQTAGKRILVETGGGSKWDDKQNKIYAFENSARLPEQLAAKGVSPESVDIVINTHLHFDHCGGNTKIVNGNLPCRRFRMRATSSSAANTSTRLRPRSAIVSATFQRMSLPCGTPASGNC